MIFTFVPTQGTQASYTPKITKAAFGDGYAQRTPKGINNLAKQWDLSFDNLDDTIKDQLRAFLFKVTKSGEAFQWKDLDDEVLYYTCDNFAITYTEEDDSAIKCKFEQFFG